MTSGVDGRPASLQAVSTVLAAASASARYRLNFSASGSTFDTDAP